MYISNMYIYIYIYIGVIKLYTNYFTALFKPPPSLLGTADYWVMWLSGEPNHQQHYHH